MFRKAILPVVITLIGALTISVLVIAKPKPTPKPPADDAGNIKITVVKAVQNKIRLSVTAQGTVTPKRQIDIVSQVSGQIVSVSPDFVNGGFFRQSQLLIQIDDSDYKVALLAAQSQQAEAERRLAEEHGLSRQAKREWRDLGNKSANDLFIRKPQLSAAKANLASAKGSVVMATLNLERTKIKVPYDGRVRATYADLGQFVTAGTRLATVYDSSVVEVRLPLSEKQASLVSLPFTATNNESLKIDFPSVVIRGSVAGVLNSWNGVLVRTDAFVDANSRTYYAVVEVKDPFSVSSSSEAPLLPGLFVEAEIEGKVLSDVMILPREALFQRDKIGALDSDNKINFVTAKVLRKTATQIWLQADIVDQTLVSIEKQSVTPQGTLVDPTVKGTTQVVSNTSVDLQANVDIIADTKE